MASFTPKHKKYLERRTRGVCSAIARAQGKRKGHLIRECGRLRKMLTLTDFTRGKRGPTQAKDITRLLTLGGVTRRQSKRHSLK